MLPTCCIIRDEPLNGLVSLLFIWDSVDMHLLIQVSLAGARCHLRARLPDSEHGLNSVRRLLRK